MASRIQVHGRGLVCPKRVYYTGKTVDATKGNRTNITDQLRVGYAVVFDLYGHDKGPLVDVTRPASAMIDAGGGVIVGFPDNPGQAPSGPAWIDIVLFRELCGHEIIDVWNDENVAIADFLGLADGQWGLKIVAGTGKDTPEELAPIAAQAVEAKDLSGTAGLIRARGAAAF